VSTIEVVVGRIGRPQGLRGEVRVDVRTDEPDRRFSAGTILRVGPPATAAAGPGLPGKITALPGSLSVKSMRWHSSRLLVSFAGISDRNQADALRGAVLFADIDAREAPEDPDEFYDHQLVGIAAFDEADRRLGEVTGLVHGGAQDLLVIRTADGRDTLVPFVKALVPEVDLLGGRVVVADRPGLVTPLAQDNQESRW
jgi:16S rRNA processing protein RimM